MAPFPTLIDVLLKAAVVAPSLHNTQPWRFQVRAEGTAIRLSANPARMLPFGDPDGRATHIACGAALLNLRVAAVAAAGLRPDVRLLPDPGRPLLLADIHLSERAYPTPREEELHAAIPRRHTNRGPFRDRAVPPGIKAELAEAAATEGAVLHFLDRGESARVLHLIIDAEFDLIADPAYRDELARWVGGKRPHDGIPDSALGPVSPEGDTPVRDFTPTRHPYPARYAWFEEHPQLAVLSVRAGGKRDWLAAGQALERVWLTATCRGISVCPLTQPLETADSWLVADPRSPAEQPQMILRIGYGLPMSGGTPRRPLADVVDSPGQGPLP